MDLYFCGPSGPEIGLKAETGLLVCPSESVAADHRGAVLVDDNFWILPAEAGVRPFAIELAGSWYKDEGGKDITRLDGVSLGGTLEGLLWAVRFGPLYHFLRRAEALFEAHKPAVVTADAGLPAWRLEILEELCRGRGARFERSGAGTAAPAPTVSRGWSRWPLLDHAGKRRFANALLSLAPRSGETWLLSHYHTIEPVLDAIGADGAVAPAFYEWPGRRWPRLAGWWRWRCLDGNGGGTVPGLERIREAWAALSESSEYRRRFEFQGRSLWPQARRMLDALVSEEFPFLAAQLGALRASLDRWAPKLVVAPYDASPPERLLLLEARRRGIPTAILVHGVPVLPRNRLCDTQADHLLVGGPVYAREYAAVGVPRERIHVVGHPLMDRYRALKRAPRMGPVRVTLITTIQPIELNVGKVLDLLLEIPGVAVTVKLHPGEPEGVYRRALSGRLGERVKLVSRVPFHEVLAGTDFLLGGASTAMFEAMAAGIPVLVTNLERTENASPFDGKSGLPACETLESLRDALGRLLPDKLPARADYEKLLADYTGPADGAAAARAVAVLKAAAR